MYLYRCDTIGDLRSQCQHDPVLRARRDEGKALGFHHHQATAARKVAPPAHAVYRMSFWSSWQALVDNMPFSPRPYAIQRISASHPTFSLFQRGDDEHLSGQAWVYVATTPVNAENPDWSADGFPHEDIEALFPDGQWRPLTQVPTIADVDLPHWEFLRCTVGGRTDSYSYQVGALAGGEGAVLIRQRSTNGRIALGMPDHLTDVVAWIAARIAIVPSTLRWFYALEQESSVDAEEIFPIFAVPKQSLGASLKAWLQSSSTHTREALTGIRPDTMTVAPAPLYQSFGLSAYLTQITTWHYSALETVNPVAPAV